ncbi:hypothetical protein ACQBAR_12950 [Propionibacteriaceae bacterium Y1685]|uniref:hypothetical protein n=1 Tax=Microlunatus sp. Y1700 TaxID=3418487 RepID=UPI003B76A59F
MGINSLIAIAVGDVSDEQLARFGLHPTQEEVSLDETAAESTGAGVGVARLGDFTVISDGAFALRSLLEDPPPVTGTWFVTAAHSVVDEYEYRVIRDGQVVRALSLDPEGELESRGEPVGDESGFQPATVDDVQHYRGEDLVWMLPLTSGLEAAHPGVELLELSGVAYDCRDEDFDEAAWTESTATRPWWKFWG